jgi:hypothetical protein
MSGQTLITSLDRAPLVRGTSSWQGFFEGEMSIENLREEGGLLRFDLILPTHQSDINDFIWTSEVEAGTTEKVVLTQAGVPVPGARVTGIRREGAGERWTHAPSEQYRIEFEVPVQSLHPDDDVQVHIRWRSGDGPWEHLATATGR